jgi:hypothetical protein
MLLSPFKSEPPTHRLTYSLLLTVLLGAGIGAFPTSAQQPDSAEVDTARTPVSTQYKSPGRALGYSLGGTVLLAPAFGAGLLIGPSFGHFYAGNGKQATYGILIRGGGAAVGLTGWGMILESSESAFTLMTIGLAIIVGSAIYDIATVGQAARQYNETHGLTAQVTPTVGPRGEQVGLSLHVSF